MSVINTELDILKKNILELVEVSKNLNPTNEICSNCSHSNPLGTTRCESCGDAFLNLIYIKLCSGCWVLNSIINSKCSRCNGTKFQINNYNLEYNRIKCIINYFIELDLTFIPALTGPPYRPKSSVIIMRHGIIAGGNNINRGIGI